MSFPGAFPVQSPTDHYQTLGVASDASYDEIAAAYWRLARDPRSRDRVPQLNEAYEVLSRSERRVAYDEERRSGRPAGQRRRVPVPSRPPLKSNLWKGIR